MRTAAAAILALLLCGCVLFQPIDPGETYRQAIEHWQRRVAAEGWTDAAVDSVVIGCIWVAGYEFEPDPKVDHWKSYNELIRDGYRGDCEDIATFIYGTLRRLGYPAERTYIRAIRTLLGTDHAVVRVLLPSGRWQVYDTTPGFAVIEKALGRRIVDWNEETFF